MADTKKTFEIKGMHCASCVSVIERALKKVEGVSVANANLATNKATVSYSAKASEDSLAKAVKGVGYELVMPKEHDHMAMTAMDDESKLKENVIVSLVLVGISFAIMIWELFLPTSYEIGRAHV